MSDVPDLRKVKVGCHIGRFVHSQVSIVVDLLLGALAMILSRMFSCSLE